MGKFSPNWEITLIDIPTPTHVGGRDTPVQKIA